MRDGSPVTIRPIRPEDEPLLIEFHSGLSDRSVYMRYFGSLSLRARVSHERLVRICFGDYDREIALVAEVQESGGRAIAGVGRLSRIHGTGEAEVAILVADKYQHHGLGSELLRRLIQVARQEGITTLSAQMMPDNHPMQRITKTLGFKVRMQPGFASVRATMDL